MKRRNVRNQERAEMHMGTPNDLTKLRERELDGFIDGIDEILSDYNGEMMVIVRVPEDENFKPNGRQSVVVGVAGIDSQIRTIKLLKEVVSHMSDQLIKSAKSEPQAMQQIVKAMGKEGMFE